MRRSMFALAVALAAVVAPSGTHAAAPGVLPAPAAAAAGLADQARDQGAGFAAETTIAGQLARAMRIAGHDTAVTAAAGPAVTFDQALRSFYRAAGVAPRSIKAPSAAVAAAVAPLIAATADAIAATNKALSALKPGEREWAAQHLDLFEFPSTEAAGRLEDIASRVDVGAMSRAAVAVADAIDHTPVTMTLAVSWTDPTGLIEIGSTGPDSYTTDRVLQIDLGGNDQYLNSAGAVGAAPGNVYGIPVSILADLGGDDFYYAAAPNQAENTLVAQGTGIGGIGLLADRWGNDSYGSYLTGSYPISPCAGDIVFGGYPGRFPQAIFAQGTGALGIGGLIDLSGTDFTSAYSYVGTSTDCHFVRGYVHAQAAGIARGVGVLIDDASNDYRSINSYVPLIHPFSADAVAGAYGQGFGAGGAGILIDKEGDDYNYANSYATWSGAQPSKGAFATTFVQGAVAGLTHVPTSTPLMVATPQLGIPVALPCMQSTRQDGGHGQATTSAPCEFFGIGIHADLLGTDTFHASADAVHGAINQCFVGSVALAGAHGAAAWGGLASLINLDVNGADQFEILPRATGGPCGGDDTRATAVGQGFGGAVRYPVWDDPNSWYANVDNVIPATPFGPAQRLVLPAIGILVSGGPPCVPGGPRISTRGPDVFVPCDPSLYSLTNSNDTYTAAPYAENQQGVATAQSWVQGSGGQPRLASPFGGSLLPASSGIGILAEAGGNDTYSSTPTAVGTTSADAKSIAQGATEGGIGALIDLLGTDTYRSQPKSAGTSLTRHQGDARAGFGEAIMPIAIFADAGGFDTYGPSITCQGNGGLGTPVLWGTLGTCGAQPGTLIIGLDALSGIGI